MGNNRLHNTGRKSARANQENILPTDCRLPFARGGNKPVTTRLSAEECRRKCPVSGAPNPCGSGSGKKGDSSRGNTASGNYRGDNVLRHVGGIVRCRSVYASSRIPPPARGSCIGDLETAAADVNNTDIVPVRSTLRAYSAPQFLHSAAFPPTSRTHAACGSMRATASGDDDTFTKFQTPSSSKAGGAPVTAADGDGDLRRYQALAASNRSIGHGKAPATVGDNDGRGSYQTSASNDRSHGCRAQHTAHGGRRHEDKTRGGHTHGEKTHEGGRKHRGKTPGDHRNHEKERMSAVTGAVGAAGGAVGAVVSGRHRPAGYLHRYMGFVQEKISSPHLESFRVAGGLGDFRQKERAAVVGRALNGHGGAANVTPATEEEFATSEPAGRRRCSPGSSERSFEGTRSPSLAGGGCSLGTSERRGTSRRFYEGRQAAAGGPSRTTAVAVKEAVYPLKFSADAGSLAPISPPNATQTIPAWCSRSKKRPNGGTKQKNVRGADGWKGSRHPTKDAPNKLTGSSISLAACKAKKPRIIRKRRAGSPYRLGILLPYDLERPVSPERGEAFRFTCN
eukprot:jgi/Undpi1/13095/HiC_scaffold_8.g02757.m1